MKPSSAILLIVLTMMPFSPIIAIDVNQEISSGWLRNSVTLDGKISNQDEWSEAHPHYLTLIGNTDGKTSSKKLDVVLRVENDDHFIYFLARVPQKPGNRNDWDNLQIHYFSIVDVPEIESDNTVVFYRRGTRDEYGWDDKSWKWSQDTTAGGKNDVEGRVTHDGANYWFEFRKKMDSKDGFDWILEPGGTYGFGGSLGIGFWDANKEVWYEQKIILKLAPDPYKMFDLYPEEKKAVEEAWKNIQTYRMKKVIVYLEDANFNPMTNVDVSVTQECLGFSLIIGSDTWSPTYWKALFYLDKRVYAASEGIMGIPGWSFIYRDGKLDFDHWEDFVHYDLLKKMYPNSTDFHWFIGPYFSALPEWDLQPAYIDGLSHEEFKIEFNKYLTELLNRYSEEADYVHVFGEANCWYGNGRRSLDEVLDIIDMETRTIREYAPKSMIVVDLDNIANESLRYFPPEDINSTWTTEYFVDQMIKRGIDFDIIGLKAYYGSGDRPAEMSLAQFSERLKELSRFGKPLYLYEMGMPSEIDPQDPGYFKIRASWHGRPNEEKQAEYMKNALIIALGNPNVTGLRYAWLIDDPNAPYPRARSQGLIKKEGNVKKAYREIEELMRQLFVEKKMRVTERLEFSGLAGRYRIDVEGFDPGYFYVKEDDDNVITVQLMKPSPQTNVTISTTCTECSYIYGWDYKRIINNPILVTIIILVPTVLVLDFFRTRRKKGCSVKKEIGIYNIFRQSNKRSLAQL